jgi:N-methylhydantoinase B
MAAAVGELPAGTATRQSTHDAIPGIPEEGITITSKVTVDPNAGKVTVDLRDNPDALPCGLNLSEACARTAAMVGVFNSIDHTVPKNAGSFRRIEVLLREGSVCGIPQHPTSCSVATTNVADRVSNPTQAAIAEIADGMGLAECGCVIPPAAGIISGIDPETNAPYVNQVFLGFTGGAGGPRADCWQTIAHVGNGGLCYQDSIELDELRHPIYVHARMFEADTEGAGRFCGARSAYAEFGPRVGSMDVAYVSDGGINGPQGVRGGLGGATASQFKLTRNGDREELPNCAVVNLRQGERIASYSCGGGGYGPPRERAPEMVCHDVAEGYISTERARDVYGVAIDDVGEVDAAATATLRAQS